MGGGIIVCTDCGSPKSTSQIKLQISVHSTARVQRDCVSSTGRSDTHARKKSSVKQLGQCLQQYCSFSADDLGGGKSTVRGVTLVLGTSEVLEASALASALALCGCVE